MSFIDYILFMEISESYFNIAYTLFILLFIATILNELFIYIKKQNPTLLKVRIIIRSWWWIISITLLAGAFGPYGVLALFSVLALLAALEYLKRSQLEKIKPQMRIFLSIFIALQIYLILNNNFEIFAALPTSFILLTLPILIFIYKDLNAVPKIMASYMGIAITTHCLFYLPAFVIVGADIFKSTDKALLCFFLVVGLTQANDIFQFIFGKLFGRNKIIAFISPNKTEAGFIGGILLTSLIGTMAFTYFINMSPLMALVCAFCISIFGIFGDLTFSAVKRHFDIKDFSSVIPGHGGFIDRLDSLIFTGPVLFLIIKYIGA